MISRKSRDFIKYIILINQLDYIKTKLRDLWQDQNQSGLNGANQPETAGPIL